MFRLSHQLLRSVVMIAVNRSCQLRHHICIVELCAVICLQLMDVMDVMYIMNFVNLVLNLMNIVRIVELMRVLQVGNIGYVRHTLGRLQLMHRVDIVNIG